MVIIQYSFHILSHLSPHAVVALLTTVAVNKNVPNEQSVRSKDVEGCHSKLR